MPKKSPNKRKTSGEKIKGKNVGGMAERRVKTFSPFITPRAAVGQIFERIVSDALEYLKKSKGVTGFSNPRVVENARKQFLAIFERLESLPSSKRLAVEESLKHNYELVIYDLNLKKEKIGLSEREVLEKFMYTHYLGLLKRLIERDKLSLRARRKD